MICWFTWLILVLQKFLNAINSIFHKQPRAGSAAQIAAYLMYNTPQEAGLYDNVRMITGEENRKTQIQTY